MNSTEVTRDRVVKETPTRFTRIHAILVVVLIIGVVYLSQFILGLNEKATPLAYPSCNTSDNYSPSDSRFFILSSSNFTISGNRIQDSTSRGIYLRQSSNNTITNNTISREKDEIDEALRNLYERLGE